MARKRTIKGFTCLSIVFFYRLGDFLKELDLTEGRCTGIPTIQEELAKNGSPRAFIETDEDRSYFLMYIPVHEGCGNVVTLKEQKEDLHKDYPKIAQRLPKGCTKHIGINHAEPKHNNQTIE